MSLEGARIDENLSFRKLEVLLAYLEAGSLARAAEQLGVSNVSVHRALHSLEESSRCALFRHEGRNLVPTDAALVLADAAREVLSSMEQGLRATRSAAGYGNGHLKLGALYSLTLQAVPEVIVGLRTRLPHLQSELVLGSDAELLAKLHQGAIDAALMAVPEYQQNLISIPLLEDEIYFAAPVRSKYSGEARIDLRSFGNERFVTLTEGFVTHRSFNRAFELVDFKPRVVMQVGDIFSLANLVGGGVGYSLLPGRVRSIFREKLQFIPLAEPFRILQTLGLSLLQTRERDPDLLALASECRLVVSRSWGVDVRD